MLFLTLFLKGKQSRIIFFIDNNDTKEHFTTISGVI